MNAKAIKLLRKHSRATIGSLTSEQDRQLKRNWKKLSPSQRGRYSTKMHQGLDDLHKVRVKLEADMEREKEAERSQTSMIWVDDFGYDATAIRRMNADLSTAQAVIEAAKDVLERFDSTGTLDRSDGDVIVPLRTALVASKGDKSDA